MRYIFLLFLILSVFSAKAGKIIIEGTAPSYVGKEMKVYRIDDYLSDKLSMITSTTVKEDSTFKLTFFNEDIEKVILRCENNRTFLYAQPGTTYNIYFPERNKYEPVVPSGNQVEITFFDLDSTDINYKILGFQRWFDYFIGGTYHLRNDKQSALFSAKLDTFKTNVQNYYLNDTSDNSFFLKTYIRYSIAGLDNINTIAERNRYEKYDFYLDKYPVSYNNDIYMEYLTSFYEKTVPRLANGVNQKFFDGVVRSSPSAIFNALGREYTLQNPKIREFVMIQSLSEAYFSPEYPKTNIETILDSLSTFAIFEEHRDIAKNVLNRITDLVPGGKAPNFVLRDEDAPVKTLTDYKGKYLYLHFLDARSTDDMRELDIMKEMYEKYSDYVQFVSLYQKHADIPKKNQSKLRELPWDSFALDSDHSILERYRVVNYSHFVLIDAGGNIVASPAPTPTPDGEYETIDRTFFYLKQQVDQGW